MFPRTWLGLVLGGCLLADSGCGPSGSFGDMVDVRGSVTYNGHPVNNATLTFTPAQQGQGRDDTCTVEKGSYQTKIWPGRYKIALEPAQNGTKLPAKYRNPRTAGLEFEVKSSQEKNWDLR